MPDIRNPSTAEITAADAYYACLGETRNSTFATSENAAWAERVALLNANSSRTRAFLEYRRSLMTNAAFATLAAQLLSLAQAWYDLVPVVNRRGSAAADALAYATEYAEAVDRSSDYLAANPIVG